MSAQKQSGGTGSKRSRNSASGPTKPGTKHVSYCPECNNATALAVVNGGQSFASCKGGHKWKVRW